MLPFFDEISMEEKCNHITEIQGYSPNPKAGPINESNKSTFMDVSETTSSSSSQKTKSKGKGVACKRRNPKVPVRRTRSNVADIGLPLGMSFAAVMAQVLYRRDAEAQGMSPSHVSSMCTSAIKECLASVYGDKLDGLTRNFEQSFDSTLSTLQLIYGSSESNEGNKINKFNNRKMQIPCSKLNKEDCSRDVVIEDRQSDSPSHAEIQDQSISHEEVRDNFHIDSITRDLALHGQSNQMVCFSPTPFGSLINSPTVGIFERSIVEQRRANDLKTTELGLKMRQINLKETELALHYSSNDLKRSKLAMDVTKTSFKAEKFKTQLEDTRYGELNKKCIDCLIAGLLIMSCLLFYGAYVHNSERIIEAAESCIPAQESYPWWAPKQVVSFSSWWHVLWCQAQIMIRMAVGFIVIIAVAYFFLQRSSTLSSQIMPITCILLGLGIVCGCCGKLCVDTLGGNGYQWLLYWEILCLSYFLSICFTSRLYPILHGPITTLQTTKGAVMFPYWIRRILFYVTLLVILPFNCGLTPFASLGQWIDHFKLKLLDSYGSG